MMTLEQRYRMLREALEFYARPANWSVPSLGFGKKHDSTKSLVENDHGKVATSAIKILNDDLENLAMSYHRPETPNEIKPVVPPVGMWIDELKNEPEQHPMLLKDFLMEMRIAGHDFYSQIPPDIDPAKTLIWPSSISPMMTIDPTDKHKANLSVQLRYVKFSPEHKKPEKTIPLSRWTLKMDIEEAEYQKFQDQFYNGDFGSQRFGQAFYNYFELHKLTDQDQFIGIYEERDSVKAKELILRLFNLT